MQIDKVTCKAIIESMNSEELRAYVWFLHSENTRHKLALDQCRITCWQIRHRGSNHLLLFLESMNDCVPSTTDNGYWNTIIKLQQTAIYRHRVDIRETRKCIEKAEKRMEILK